ncbi:carboxypeptidase regulatory-like domain-containing protein, partial [Pedobacter sp.]|uniref:carboxypeptidase regulatory-like domain-containing protein n=1 Tax=Pedobacter sp. TaxID=1411316 RepID=UPI002C6691AA
MRLTIFLIIATILQVSASGYGQQVTLRKKNVTLEEVFRVIKIQTDYNVLWQPDKLKGAKTIDADFKNTALETVLNQVLHDHYSYVIDHKTIVVSVKEKSILNIVLDYFKTIHVKGKVTDGKGNPLPGATLKIKNGNRVVKTNAEGQYEFRDLEEN